MSEVRDGVTWHRVLDAGALPEGRVTTVVAGTRTLALTHFEGKLAALGQPVPAPRRTARRGFHRERLASLSVARLGLPSMHRQATRRLRRRGPHLPSGGARRRNLGGPSRSRRARPHGHGRDGGDDDRLGDRHRVRDGGALQPGARRRRPPSGAGGEAAILRSASRRGGVVRVLGVREAHGPTRRVPVHRRAGSDESAHRSLGCQGGPRSRARTDRSGEHAGSGARRLPGSGPLGSVPGRRRMEPDRLPGQPPRRAGKPRAEARSPPTRRRAPHLPRRGADGSGGRRPGGGEPGRPGHPSRDLPAGRPARRGGPPPARSGAPADRRGAWSAIPRGSRARPGGGSGLPHHHDVQGEGRGAGLASAGRRRSRSKRHAHRQLVHERVRPDAGVRRIVLRPHGDHPQKADHPGGLRSDGRSASSTRWTSRSGERSA